MSKSEKKGYLKSNLYPCCLKENLKISEVTIQIKKLEV